MKYFLEINIFLVMIPDILEIISKSSKKKKKSFEKVFFTYKVALDI